MISVKKLLTDKPQSNVWSVSPDNTVIEALFLMTEKNIGAVVVLDDAEKLVGIFSSEITPEKELFKAVRPKVRRLER
ncbi:MAG: CBS domain-containing protein [Spirosomataceae bacterium]